nr:hypothetical protein [Tanacetum cinerariifolium]
MELKNRYYNLVSHRFRTQEKLDHKMKYIKELRSEVTTLDKKLEEAQGDHNVLAQKNRELGPPPSSPFIVVFEPLQIEGSAHAPTSNRSFSQKGSATSGFVGKPRAEDVRRCLDPLNKLARGALARNSEYDQTLEDDFATTSRGEEIDLTLFPLALGLYVIPYPFDGISSPPFSRQQWDGPHALKDNILAKDIFKDPDGMELKNRYYNLVSHWFRTQEKLDHKMKYIKELRSEVTTLDKKLEEAQGDHNVLAQKNRELPWTDVKLSDYALVVRDLLNELGLERSRLLLSDESYTALAHVLSYGKAFGVVKGLRMGHTDVEFDAASWNVSNFLIGAEVEFNKGLDAFPSIQFPFLGKVASTAKGPLSKVIQIMLEKFLRSTRSVSNVAVAVSEVPNQAPVD